MNVLTDLETRCQIESHRHTPVLVHAGPGSGKTQILVDRLFSYIREGTIPAKKIWITAFNRNTIDEIYRRAYEGLRALNVSRDVISHLNFFTLQGLSNHLLKSGRHLLQFEIDPRGLNDRMQRCLLHAAMPALFKNIHEDTKRSLLKNIGEIINAFDMITRSTLYNPKELIEAWKRTKKPLTHYEERRKILGLNLSEESLIHLYKYHRSLCRSMNYMMTYNQATNALIHGLRSNCKFREHIDKKIDVILIDEIQDVNIQQIRLIDILLSHKQELTIVGDFHQAIYQFRGSWPHRIKKKLESIPSICSYHLSKNFRSRFPIVSALECIYKQENNNIERSKESYIPVYDLIKKTKNEIEDDIIALIKDLHESEKIKNYGAIAIISPSIRSVAIKDLASRLEENKIPINYHLYEGYLNNPYVKSLITILSLFTDRNTIRQLTFFHAFSYYFKLNIDQSTKNSHNKLTVKMLIEILSHQQDKESDQLLILVKKASALSLSQQAWELLSLSSRFQQSLPEEQNPYKKLLPFAPFFRLLRESEDLGLGNNNTVLDIIERFSKGGRFPGDKPLADPTALHILTTHQAKGLEFPITILYPAQQSSWYPQYRAPLFGLPYDNDDSPPEDEQIKHHYDSCTNRLYVAASRARDVLIFASSENSNYRKIKKLDIIKKIQSKSREGTFISTDKQQEINISTITERTIIPVKNHNSIRWSFSMAKSINLCPRRFWFSNENFGIGIPESTTHHALRGRMIHEATLSLLKENKKILYNDISQESIDWSEIAKKSYNKSGGYKPSIQYEEYIKELNNIKAPPHNSAIECVDTERFISGNIGSFIIEGYIDLIIKSHKGIGLVELKSRHTPHHDETQLHIYSYLWKENYGEWPNFSLFYFLDSGQWKFVKINKAKSKEQITRFIEKAHESIEKQNFTGRPGPICKSCIYKSFCPEISKVI